MRLQTLTCMTVIMALLSCSSAHAPIPDDDCAPGAFSVTGWVDRIEGDWAVVSDDEGRTEVWPAGCLPNNAREGVFLRGGRIDVARTRQVRRSIDRLLGSMEVWDGPANP